MKLMKTFVALSFVLPSMAMGDESIDIVWNKPTTYTETPSNVEAPLPEGVLETTVYQRSPTDANFRIVGIVKQSNFIRKNVSPGQHCFYLVTQFLPAFPVPTEIWEKSNASETYCITIVPSGAPVIKRSPVIKDGVILRQTEIEDPVLP